MTFTMKIQIVDGRLQDITFDNVAQTVTVGMALQAVEAAKAALLNIPVAQPNEQPTLNALVSHVPDEQI